MPVNHQSRQQNQKEIIPVYNYLYFLEALTFT